MPTATRFSFVVLSAIVLFEVGCGGTARDRQSDVDSATVAFVKTPTRSGAAREVEVIGLDYAFSMPDSVDAGRTAFKFTNNGKVFHEYNIVLLKEGATLQQFIDALNKNEPTLPFVDKPVGVLFASSGKSSDGFLSTDLLPGRTYAVQCIFRDSATAPSHREMGMFKAVGVRNTVPLAAPTVTIDTIVGTDYAYSKYPRTIKPGWHHFIFVNEGKQRHEISLALLKPGISVAKAIEVASKDGDLDALFDGDFGVLHGLAGTTPLGTLDFEVLPDREYVIVCSFQDTPKSPPHFALGMVTSLVASK